MESSQITRGREGRPKKTIRETINKDLEINELDRQLEIWYMMIEHYGVG